MFQLARETDPRWALGVVEHLDELLLEHSHLERKAASSALQFMFRYSEYPVLQRPLSELAREELSHFEAVLGVMETRGIVFAPQKASPYAGKLLSVVRSSEPLRLLDRLLCAAIIEARSCERMKLLAEALSEQDVGLRDFYRALVRSEARHYGLYVDLAKEIFSAEEVDSRLLEIAAHEGRILSVDSGMARMHSGGCSGGSDDG